MHNGESACKRTSTLGFSKNVGKIQAPTPIEQRGHGWKLVRGPFFRSAYSP